MPRHAIAQLPEGYLIARLKGKQYPLQVSFTAQGVPVARGFVQLVDGHPVSYSKRVYAANFLANYDAGRAPWAEIDGQEDRTGYEQARREWIDATVDNKEYNAYLD